MHRQLCPRQHGRYLQPHKKCKVGIFSSSPEHALISFGIDANPTTYFLTQPLFSIVTWLKSPSTLHLWVIINWTRLELSSTLFGSVPANQNLHLPQVLNNTNSINFLLRLSAPRLIHRECYLSPTFASKPSRPASYTPWYYLRNISVQTWIFRKVCVNAPLLRKSLPWAPRDSHSLPRSQDNTSWCTYPLCELSVENFWHILFFSSTLLQFQSATLAILLVRSVITDW